MIDLVYEACKILKTILQARAPYRTGNLAINGIRIVDRSRVVIGGEIADYAIFTNKRGSKKGWVENAIQEAVPIIQRVLSRQATPENIKETNEYYGRIIENRRQKLLAMLQAKRERIMS